MPLNLPDKLPAIDLLKEENIFVIDTSRASTQDIVKGREYLCHRYVACEHTRHPSVENRRPQPDAD